MIRLVKIRRNSGNLNWVQAYTESAGLNIGCGLDW